MEVGAHVYCLRYTNFHGGAHPLEKGLELGGGLVQPVLVLVGEERAVGGKHALRLIVQGLDLQ